MKQAEFRFYAELNDFLQPGRRGKPVRMTFQGEQSVKHLVESAGVPHTEIDLVLVNSEPVEFSYRLRDGDRVSVYPMFEAFDVTAVSRVRAEPLRQTRFILDVHLARLARYLRLCGFDTVCEPDAADEELAERSAAERRILLTRDRGLLQRRAVTHGYSVRATAPRQQLLEVVGRFDLAGSFREFTRCLRCNELLREAPKAAVMDRVPERSRDVYQEFRECPGCRRLYWPGSHFERMRAMVAEVKRQAGGQRG